MLCHANAQQCPGANEQYVQPGPGCPQTCDTFDVTCNSYAAGPPGCYCNDGFVRDANNKCVSGKILCRKPTCNKISEEYSDVGACEPTCGNLNSVCTDLPGCYCRNNFYRDGKRCVSDFQCKCEYFSFSLHK